ncbi:MAG: ribosome biogenesis GTP-binding protein YihA/YsxC [Candidatus Margulisbacteria bacterium]|nr:ribosome biogenesis GTP-binding protein YihA/YsxC [Candidatus Margulisiibacteriota bacterium]
MQIKKTQFITGMTQQGSTLRQEIPQIAFIGRSNVGKSSAINALTNNKNLAKTSSYPGRTQQINIFLINDSTYFVDLPGYGFTKTSKSIRTSIGDLINWYFDASGYEPKVVVLIVDAHVGPTESDVAMLNYFKESNRNIIVLANKIDKIKQSEFVKKLRKVEEFAGKNKVIPFSSEKKQGIYELYKEIF